MKTALLTVNVGGFMAQNTRDSLADACKRWRCDFVQVEESCVFHDRLIAEDPPTFQMSTRTHGDCGGHPAGLKLQAFELCDADRIFIIDADTVIRANAPNPFELYPEQVALYASKNQQEHFPPAYVEANPPMAAEQLNRIHRNLTTCAMNAEIREEVSKQFFNSGVMLVTRKHHAEVFAKALRIFQSTPLEWWDQMAINYAAFFRGFYYDLGPLWNYQFPQDLNWMTAYVYHFAGDPTRYERLKTVNWRNV